MGPKKSQKSKVKSKELGVGDGCVTGYVKEHVFIWDCNIT